MIPVTASWDGGVPVVTEACEARQLLCFLAKRCTVCGGEWGDRLWHVTSGPTPVPPGHHACMRYAALTFPKLVGVAEDGPIALVEYGGYQVRPRCLTSLEIVLWDPVRTEVLERPRSTATDLYFGPDEDRVCAALEGLLGTWKLPVGT